MLIVSTSPSYPATENYCTAFFARVVVIVLTILVMVVIACLCFFPSGEMDTAMKRLRQAVKGSVDTAPLPPSPAGDDGDLIKVKYSLSSESSRVKGRREKG